MISNKEYTDLVLRGEFPEERKVPLDIPFLSHAGSIQNLVLKPISCVSILKSVKDSIRSNHYHLTDYHYLYVLSGKVAYFERSLGEKEIPEHVIYNTDEMFFTPPNVEHVTYFLEDTVLVSMSKNPRSHEEHENDLVRVNFVSLEKCRELLCKR
jgi:dTDP-4-dehydrorhamnose 3,5-epimerase-like enzyme